MRKTDRKLHHWLNIFRSGTVTVTINWDDFLIYYKPNPKNVVIVFCLQIIQRLTNYIKDLYSPHTLQHDKWSCRLVKIWALKTSCQ